MPHDHICGLYFNQDRKRHYLPQVELKSHTTITPACFTTKLTQTFENPNEAVLSQLRYTFPLYDGVAVNGYFISYGDKVIHGVVEQKDQAKKTYQAAVDRGETAGLLESLPAGVFGVTLGNVPAKTNVVVDITYCGELKHDAGIDGLRYMLPTSIAPRYGIYPGEILKSNAAAKGGINITVDVDMAGSAIRKVQSPSHPIAVSMGSVSTAADGDKTAFSPAQASATLTKGTTELADDFILQLLIDDISAPQAVLETHPTLPNQRALMTTLVPKFALEPAHPEIVFIADQSGSMRGSKNAALVKALKVFLKSLPLGVRFNICAFGNTFKFLFPKSQAYSEDNLNTALAFVESFEARYGGTEILKPIKAAFEQHLTDLPLEVMLLTDGEVWDEAGVFSYVNEQISAKKADARVFALGIGEDVSHTLVEGAARAGYGFAQFVIQDEETDQKVMRMLRGALYAHTWDYGLEVHYSENDKDVMSDDEEFEIVEKVNECLSIDEKDTGSGDDDSKSASKVTSFYDTSTDLDKPIKSDKATDRYAHLPAIETPKLLQAPSTIPPLFPFNRTTLYLLLSPETTQKKVSSVTLRATSSQGPLELTIPVHATAGTTGTTIHQLAARKATQDLEEGRGWLQAASLAGGEAVKTKFSSRFDEIVERECVRLGERFQVAGKFTSFVAVEAGGKRTDEAKEAPSGGYGSSAPVTDMVGGGLQSFARLASGGAAPRKQLASKAARKRYVGDDDHKPLFSDASGRRRCSPPADIAQARPTSGALFGATPAWSHKAEGLTSLASSAPSSGVFARAAPPPPSAHGSAASFAASSTLSPPPSQPEEMSIVAVSPSFSPAPAAEMPIEAEMSDEEQGFALFDASSDGGGQDCFAKEKAKSSEEEEGDAPTAPANKKMKALPPRASRPSAYRPPFKTNKPSSEDEKKMSTLIDLQTFSGAWGWSSALLSLLGVGEAEVKKASGEVEGEGWDETKVATALAIAFLEVRVKGKREVWEMVAQKGRGFLGEEGKEVVGKMEALF